MLDWQRVMNDNVSIQQLTLLSEAVQTRRATGRDQVLAAFLYQYAEQHWGLDRRWVGQHLRALKKREFIDFEEAVAGIIDFYVMPAGFDAADEFEEHRSNKAKRFVAVRDQFLKWMYEQLLDDVEYPNADDFLTSKFNDFVGTTFTEQEVTRGLGRLLDDDFVHGTRTLPGAITGFKLSPSGIAKVENNESVAVRSGAPTVNHFDQRNYSKTNSVAFHDSPGTQVAVDSQNVTQTSTMTAPQVDAARDVADGVRRLLPMLELSPEKEQEALEVLESLDAELESPAPEASKGKALVNKIGEVAATSTVSSLVSMVGVMVQQFMGIA